MNRPMNICKYMRDTAFVVYVDFQLNLHTYRKNTAPRSTSCVLAVQGLYPWALINTAVWAHFNCVCSLRFYNVLSVERLVLSPYPLRVVHLPHRGQADTPPPPGLVHHSPGRAYYCYLCPFPQDTLDLRGDHGKLLRAMWNSPVLFWWQRWDCGV